jgi:hypothetical protein
LVEVREAGTKGRRQALAAGKERIGWELRRTTAANLKKKIKTRWGTAAARRRQRQRQRLAGLD